MSITRRKFAASSCPVLQWSRTTLEWGGSGEPDREIAKDMEH